MQTHTNQKKTHDCGLCKESFSTPSRLKRHLAFHARKAEKKQAIVSSSGACTATVNVHDPESIQRPFVCVVCGKGFSAPSMLKRHGLVHSDEKSHECSICSKRFADIHNLQEHMRVHTEEEKFCKCDVCGKSFYTPSDLKRHYSVHTGKKPHVCTICSKAFLKCYELKRHMKAFQTDKLCVSPGTGEASVGVHDTGDTLVPLIPKTFQRPNVCDVCGKDFMAPSQLKRHAVMHLKVGLVTKG
ncbi:zinc finger protein 596-like [Wyeomyia smithii]|uniref:zinc finger protein 596-like n=1 Tax=Wyeomyia smithii TaxID=174621 RepID=UPI002467BDA0|nr:zinc finger protein 596-like [Wyeomyia smithii]